MDAISYSGFRQQLKGFMHQVNEDADPIIVTAKDKDDNVVIIGQRDYDAMVETLEILSNEPLMAKLRRGDQQFSAGRGKQHDLIEDDQ